MKTSVGVGKLVGLALGRNRQLESMLTLVMRKQMQ